MIAIIWLVYTRTGSAIDIALLGIAGVVPRVGFGLISGGLADRYSKSHLMLIGDFIRAAFLFALAFSLVIINFNFSIVLLSAFMLGIGQSLFRTSITSFLPSAVEPEMLGKANGLFSTSEEVFAIIGSPLGGILIALIGIAPTIAINAATYFISGIFTVSVIFLQLRDSRVWKSEKKNEPLVKEIAAGMSYVRKERALLKLTISSFAANFFLSLFFTFLIIFVHDVLLQGALVFGILSAAASIGVALGSLLVGWTRVESRFGIWYSIGWGLGGVAILGVVLVPSVISMGIFLFAVGLGGGFGNTVFFTGVQKYVPRDLLGRFLSIDEVGSLAANPAGQASGGFVIAYLGINLDFVIASLGTATSILMLLLFRDVRALRTGDAGANGNDGEGSKLLEDEEGVISGP